MSKTIEELAKQYAEDMCPIGNYCGDVYDEQRHFEMSIYLNNAKDVLEWLYQQPLASRLTAEAKERVRKMYKELSECIENRTADVEYLKGKRCQLVIIFGADFFKEGE